MRSVDVPVQGAFAHGATDAEERLRLHVVLAQVHPNSSDEGHVGEALPKLAALAKDAAAQGADVIVFPEYFLTGATHGAWHSVRRRPALEGHAIAPWVSEIADIAAAHDIAIVTGSVVQLRAFAQGDDTEHGLYNTTYFLDRKGTVCGIYTKRNLWHSERAILAQATDATHPLDDQAASFVFETRRGLSVRAAMVMCWDLMFPEAFRRMIGPVETGAPASDLDRPGQWIGPDVIFAPTCWFADDSGPAALAWNAHCEAACLSTSPADPDALTVCRAMENESYVCMCNAAGPPATSAAPPRGLGLSSCNAPLLGCTARIEHERETLLYHTLDLRVLGTARDVYRVRYDLHDGVLRAP